VANIDTAKNSRLLDAAGVKAVRTLPNELVVDVFNVDDLHRVDEAAGTHALSVDQPLLSERVEHLD